MLGSFGVQYRSGWGEAKGRGVPDLPHERGGSVVHDAPGKRVPDLLYAEHRHQRAISGSFSTIVPEWPVARSATLMCRPSFAGVTKKWTVIVSPARITSGAAFGPSRSIALNATPGTIRLFFAAGWVPRVARQHWPACSRSPAGRRSWSWPPVRTLAKASTARPWNSAVKGEPGSPSRHQRTGLYLFHGCGQPVGIVALLTVHSPYISFSPVERRFADNWQIRLSRPSKATA